MIRPLARPAQEAAAKFAHGGISTTSCCCSGISSSSDNASHGHGGIPIGAIQIASSHMQSFKDLVKQMLLPSVPSHKSLWYRGVQPFVGPRNQFTGDSSKLLLVHVPPAVATALEDDHPELTDFLRQHGGVYLPGLRRSRMHRCATRKRRNANTFLTDVMMQPRSPKKNDADTDSNSSSTKPPEDSTFTFSELFAGIGGFRLGLDAAGGRCVFANEKDPYASSIYRRNFDTSTDNHFIEADILDVCAKNDIPADTDILTAGFPCQPFSTRGKQRGFSDERGQLYREIVRVLRGSHPKSFIFENVAGLVSLGTGGGGRFRGHGLGKGRGEAGSVFQIMLRAFEDCGYDVTWNICNSRHYVAQQRERVFIVGVRKDLVGKQKFSWDWYDQMLHNGGSDSIPLRVCDIMEPPDSPAVLESELSPQRWTKLQEIHSERGNGIINAHIDIDAKAPTLISSYRRSGNITSKFIFRERDGTKREIPRFLTPRECCRIQGFPEEYVVPSIGVDGDIETAHFYSGIGNAVVPPVVASIGKELIACLRC